MEIDTGSLPSFFFFCQISHVGDPDPRGEVLDPTSSWKDVKNLWACLATNSVSISRVTMRNR